jgi:hypothetical protein
MFVNKISTLKDLVMKIKIVIFASILFATLAWLRNDSENLPLPPSDYTTIGKTVHLKFKLNKRSMAGVEFALNQGHGANNFFLLFDFSDDWVKGDFGLILKGMAENSLIKTPSKTRVDISQFEKDANGKKISYYEFDQTLIVDEEGESFIKMSYVGPTMPLVHSLKIEKDLPLPRHISARFVNKSNLVFKAGKYRMDKKINGFWIGVEEL